MTQLQRIKVELIDSPILTRPYSETHAKGLMASIKAEGLHTPIKVFQKDARYILGPGMHRLMAARMLGDTEIDAVVDAYDNDEQVRAAQRAENILRENMNPMEEALAIEQAVLDNGDNEQLTADKLGKPLVYVQQRLALLALTPESREALVKRQITLRHAQLLAKIGDAGEQNGLLERCAGTGFTDMAGPGHKEREEYKPPMSTEDLANWVRARQRDLEKDATWDLNTPFGSHGRDCTNCPANSANKPELFVDSKKSAKTCGDGACFDEKKTLTIRRTKSVAWQLAKDGINGVPMTVKNCKGIGHAAIAVIAQEKDAVFVTDAAVREALPAVIKQQQASQGKDIKKAAGGKTEKQQTAEKNATGVRRSTVQDKLGAAMQDWKNRALEQAAVAVQKSPLACGYLVLLSTHGLWKMAERNNLKQDDRKKFVALLAVAPKAAAEDLARIARTIELPRKLSAHSRQCRISLVLDNAAPGFGTWGSNADTLTACFVEAFGVDTMKLGPKPTFADIEAKLFPPEKKPDAKAVPKAKTRRKAA